MGGYAAIDQCCKIKGSAAIVFNPQFSMGLYLNQHKDKYRLLLSRTGIDPKDKKYTRSEFDFISSKDSRFVIYINLASKDDAEQLDLLKEKLHCDSEDFIKPGLYHLRNNIYLALADIKSENPHTAQPNFDCTRVLEKILAGSMPFDDMKLYYNLILASLKLDFPAVVDEAKVNNLNNSLNLSGKEKIKLEFESLFEILKENKADYNILRKALNLLRANFSKAIEGLISELLNFMFEANLSSRFHLMIVYNSLYPLYDQLSNDLKESFLTLFFHEKIERKCPVLVYKIITNGKNFKDSAVFKDARKVYLKERKELYNLYYELLFCSEHLAKTVLQMLLFHADELGIYVIAKMAGPQFMIQVYEELINEVLQSELLNGLDAEVAFEHVLLSSCINRNYTIEILRKYGWSQYGRNKLIADSASTILKALESPNIPIRKNIHSNKLRIAVCISGQMRGYKECFETWKKFGLANCDCDFYVQTWRARGVKFPEVMHADRRFSGHFLEAYKSSFSGILNLENFIKQNYPNLYQVLLEAANSEITREELYDFYKATDIVINDDKVEPYASFDNPKKMYFNIFECDKLRKKREYDLVLRIRPDLFIADIVEEFDFLALLEESIESRSFFVLTPFGRTYNFTPIWGYGCDDAFAIGCPEVMTIYANTYNYILNENKYKLSKDFSGHRSLAYSTLYQGISIRSLFDKYKPNVQLVDSEPIPIEKIYTALKVDAKEARYNGNFSNSCENLIKACELDIRNLP